MKNKPRDFYVVDLQGDENIDFWCKSGGLRRCIGLWRAMASMAAHYYISEERAKV